MLYDESGKLSKRTRAKLLEILGFGSVDNALDLESLHVGKAESENVTGYKEDILVDEYDDHEIHISEHTRYLLSAESEKVRKDPSRKERAIAHLRAHKVALLGE